MVASTGFEDAERGTADQIVAGYFQDVVHRARPGAPTVELGETRFAFADCGAVTDRVRASIAGWRICTTCWPAGPPITPEPSRPDVPSTPLPDCLNWRAPAGAVARPVALVSPASASPATGWFEAST